MNDQTIKRIITPHDQVIRTVFGASRSYFIDIYQREYRWSTDNVETLLTDIDLRFSLHARKETSPKEIQRDVLKNFEPYYLNTFLTHSSSSATSIVDGQQRLTTLLLMLIKLYRLTANAGCDPDGKPLTFSGDALRQLIFEQDDFGEAGRFKIFNPNREAALRSLIDEDGFEAKDETQKRILENFAFISKWMDEYFGDPQSEDGLDTQKLTYFIAYLLDRISIVEIKIESQTNVAMIFEVVNDRGLGLNPHEILKGKLIGNLPEAQKENCNSVWTRLQNLYYTTELKHSTDSSIGLDDFFRTFFRAKFANTEGEYEKYEKDYHYEIYRNPEIRDYFGNFESQDLLNTRITQDIEYFARLYHEIRSTYALEPLIFNKLLDQNQQYLLILSTIRLNDKDREAKILRVAQKFDQAHTVMRLLDVYDSSSFQRWIYPLNRDLRDRELSEIDKIFDRKLISFLVEQEVIGPDEVADLDELFQWERFRGMRNRWTNFSKYVLMRIDRYLADLLDVPSYVSEDIEKVEDRFNKSTRRRHGLHLEHILAFNDFNRQQFTENGAFDESQFNETRNRLGMVLLLQDKQNQSSNAEPYGDKVQTYKQSGFIWNDLLVGNLHSVNARNVPHHWPVDATLPTDQNTFPLDKVADRQRLVFTAVRDIWMENLKSDA